MFRRETGLAACPFSSKVLAQEAISQIYGRHIENVATYLGNCNACASEGLKASQATAR